MKGIIFNLLEEAVTRDFGANTWDELLKAAGLDGVYTSLGNYADEDVYKLVAAASTALSISPAAVLQWFGRGAIPVFVERYPAFFVGHTTTTSFLVTLDNLVHPEVNKLYPAADTPHFEFVREDDGTLKVSYYSHRKLCALAEGFMQGAAAHYNEHMHLEHPECMHRGAPKCVFNLKFSSNAIQGSP